MWMVGSFFFFLSCEAGVVGEWGLGVKWSADGGVLWGADARCFVETWTGICRGNT